MNAQIVSDKAQLDQAGATSALHEAASGLQKQIDAITAGYADLKRVINENAAVLKELLGGSPQNFDARLISPQK